VEINQIYYFLEICKTGKISKAADNLHITQQGLSISMRRLEEELSSDLFYRKSNGLILTDDGQFFKIEAEKIIKHVEKIKNHCMEKQYNKTSLSVAVTDSIIVRLPTKLQRLFINGNENFAVNLIETYSKPCADFVADNEADFAVIYGRFLDSVLEYKQLDNVQQVIIVNKDHPLAKKQEVTLAELSGEPFVTPDKYSWPRIAMAKLFEQNGAQLNIVYECNRPRQTIDLISNNPKIIARTIEPEITEADLEYVHVLRLKDDPFVLPINLCYRKDTLLNPAKRAFLSLILAAYDK
jgi:DNA-binding transcriptional LysR family regulator